MPTRRITIPIASRTTRQERLRTTTSPNPGDAGNTESAVVGSGGGAGAPFSGGSDRSTTVIGPRERRWRKLGGAERRGCLVEKVLGADRVTRGGRGDGRPGDKDPGRAVGAGDDGVR